MSTRDGYIAAAAPKDISAPRYGSADEARKIRRLIRYMARQGFRVHSLAVDGEGFIRTGTERAAVCEVFEWDAYVTLRFRRVRGTLDQITSGQLYGVLIVTGNGADIFSDWTCDDTREDASSDNATPGTFFAAMWAFVDADEGREV